MKRDFFRFFLAKDREVQGRSNPLFPTPKKPLWKKVLLAVLFLGLVIAGVYLFYKFSTRPSLYLQNVAFSGVVTLAQSDIDKKTNALLEKRRALFFTGRHKWFFDEKRLETELESAFPLDVTAIEITDQTLQVTIIEDILMSAVKHNEIWSLVSLEGQILRDLTPEEVGYLDVGGPVEVQIDFLRLPKIELQGVVELSDAGHLLEPKVFAAIIELDEGLHDLGLTPTRFVFRTPKDNWIRLYTKEKTYSMLFDLERPIDSQLFMLKTVLEEYKDRESELSYIDVRFGNHVYVK